MLSLRPGDRGTGVTSSPRVATGKVGRFLAARGDAERIRQDGIVGGGPTEAGCRGQAERLIRTDPSDGHKPAGVRSSFSRM